MPKTARTILVADSRLSSVDNYAKLLEQNTAFSYQVLAESDLTQVVARCERQSVDALVLDLHDSQADLFGLLAQLTQQLGATCPAIVVVADGEVKQAVQALKLGATDYLVRAGLTPDELSLALHTAIETTQQRRIDHQTQAQFQASVETMLDCFGLFSAVRNAADEIIDFRIDYLNAAARADTHMAVPLQLGRGLCELVPAYRESEMFAAYQQLIETGVPLVKDSVSCDYASADNLPLAGAFSLHATPLNDGFVACWRDITPRKQLELELHNTVANLQQKQARLERLIDTAPIGIGIGTASGEVTVANDTMLALHGSTRAEFDQRGLNWRDFVPPELAESTELAMAELDRTGLIPATEKELLRPDGTRLPVWISAMRWLDNDHEHVAFAVDLSQQKQAEAALKASQKRYQDLAEAMPSMVWTADAAGMVTYWNQRWYEYTGLTPTDSHNEDGIVAVHPEERDRTLALWRQSIATGAAFELEYRLRAKTGHYQWFISRAIPIRNGQNQVTSWIGTITNINDLKQNQAIIHQSERQVRRVLNSLYSFVGMLTPNGILIEANQTALDAASLQPSDVLGRPFEQAYWWSYSTEVQTQLRAAIERAARGEMVRYDVPVRVSPDQLITIDFALVPLLDANGQVEYIIPSGIDISERKQAEARVQANQAQLQQQLVEIESIYQSAPIGLAVLDADLRFVRINQRLAEINGLSVEEHIGRTVRQVLPDLADEAEQLISTIFATGEPQLNIEVNGETPARPGVQRTWLESFLPLKNGDQVVGINIVCEEITERKRQQVEASQREAALQAALQRLDSHVENTPLAVIEWDQDFKVSRWSQAAERIFGWSAEETMGRGFDEIGMVYPEDSDHVADNAKQLVEGTAPQIINRNRNYTKAGNVIHCEWYNSSLLNEAGQMTSLLSLALDITEQVQTQQSLQDSEERFRTLADNISQFAWMADQQGSIFWYNQRWFDYTGTTLDEMQGWGWQQVHHPDYVEQVTQKFRHHIETGERWEDTFPLRGQDGQYRWFLSRAIPVRDAQGRVQRWLGTNTDITELRQTELALQQATERLNVALKSTPITLFNQDQDLRYTWIYNPTNNFSEADILGRQDTDLVSPEAAAPLIQLKGQVLETGTGLRQEVTTTVPGCPTAYYDLTIEPLHDRQGNLIGISCAAVDITHHKQTELALQETYIQLEAALVAGSIYTWRWDMASGLIVTDRNFAHLFGVDPEAAAAGLSLGQFLNAVHPDDRPQVAAKIEQAIATGELYASEYRVRNADGEERWVIARGQVDYDESGRPIAFPGALADITNRKQTEAALRQSEDRLRMALDAAQMGTWDWDLTTNQLIWDDVCKALFGLPSDAEISIETFFQALHPDDLPRLEQIVHSAIAQATTAAASNYDDEYRVISLQDGIERWIAAKGQVYVNKSGHPVRFVGTVLDITERKQAEAERERLLRQEQAAREAAERANRIKDEFLAVLSHELRSPLNPILGWSKLLQTRSFAPEKLNQALGIIERNAKTQTQLIDDLLDVAKILRGKLSLNTTPVRLPAVIEAAIDTVRTAAEGKSITIEPVLLEVGRVSGDMARLQQIVWNLLSNAIKFTPEGGRVEIRLEEFRAEPGQQFLLSSYPSTSLPGRAAAQITVTDSGRGISADFLPHIFESFRQEDASTTRQYGGLGLGLAIVRQLVEAHGGTITATSAGEGRGAAFTVRLPLLHTAPAEPSPPRSEPDMDLTGLQILTVDDDPDTRDLVTMLLTEYGAEVIAVTSAPEALATLMAAQPDILISDIGMPDVDGYGLIQQVRALSPDQGGQVPAIALTAYAREEDQQKAIASGFQRYLTKPLDLEELVQTVLALARG